MSAKLRFEAAVIAADFGGEEKGRELARFLKKGESTVRGWRNPKARDRRPTDEAILKLEERAEFLRLGRKLGALA